MNKLLETYYFKKKIRCGVNADGGYVFGGLNGNYDCYISAGISNEESFTRDFLQKYKIAMPHNYAFDGTIRTYPSQYCQTIQFIRKNISGENTEATTNLDFLTNKYKDIFLKMDIEGGEYPWIKTADLNPFKQIVIEFHGINDDGWGTNLEDKKKCLEKLNETHYIVHAHGNNFGPVNGSMPNVLELTYIRKNYFTAKPELNHELLPMPNLDFPNNPQYRDIPLNFNPFFFNFNFNL
jgi:hypothetical protein